MTLQNRVDPFGQFVAVDARGRWMGNRGVLHDADRHIRRSFRLKAWLICALEFNNRRRRVMSPGLYTELFFLDEATALAAGHRPCAECRRADYLRFKRAAEQGAAAVFPHAADLDAALHADRLDGDGGKRTWRTPMAALPEGVFVRRDSQAWLLRGGALHRWTASGYADSVSAGIHEAEVLTPRLTVEALRAGYAPQMA